MKRFLRNSQLLFLKLFLSGFVFLLVSGYASATPITYNWTGASGTDWNTPGNWSPSGVPGTSDIAQIGVAAGGYTNQPVISSTPSSISSLVFGTLGLINLGASTSAITLTVNSGFTLAVTGSITQNSSSTVLAALATSTFTTTLAGAGTITCAGSLTVGNNNTFLAVSLLSTNNLIFASTISNFSVTGNVVVNSTTQGTTVIPLIVAIGFDNATFSLQGGTTSIGGTIKTVNTPVGVILSGNSTPIFSVDVPTGSALNPILQLAAAHAIDASSVAGTIDFYNNTGGTGTCTVNYNGASQEIYTTSSSTILNSSPQTYQNLSLTGTGTKTTDGASLTVGANLNSSAPTVVFNTNNTTVTVGGNWVNSSSATQGTGVIGIAGNWINSGAFSQTAASPTGTISVGGNWTNSASVTQFAGSVTVTGAVTNNSGGTLNLGTANLTVTGNYTNSGTGVYTQSTGTTIFNGVSAQTLTDNSLAGTIFNTVNFTSGGTKTMAGTKGFWLSNTAVLTMAASTILQTGNVLTLNSSSTSTATVALIPSTSSITGTVNSQRYISGGSNAYRGYRFLSSPVYTATTGSGATANYFYSLLYLASFGPITSTSGALGGFTKAGNPSMYLYRDNVVFTNATFNTGNFRSINAINYTPSYSIGIDYDGVFSLHAGTGFLYFYRGDLSNVATKYITTTSAEANLFVSTGTLNQQAITVVNWYTQASTLQYDVVSGNPAGYAGYNLVGNPYASSIDWNTFSTSSPTAGIYGPNVSNTIYIYNEVAKVYATYNGSMGTNGGSRTIPSGQGFFVKATSSGASLTFNEAAKVNTQVTGPTQATGTTLLMSKVLTNADVNPNPLQYIRLEMAADSINKEETIISLNQNASNGFVTNEDSPHLMGNGKVSLFSISADSIALAINNIPLPKPSETIRLNAGAAADGLYTINRTEINNIPALYRVWLMDAYMKDSLDIKNNTTYAFNVYKADTNSYGANRFSIVIRQDSALMVHLLSFAAAKESNGAQLTWITENEANYTNFTVQRSTDGGLTFNALGSLMANGARTYNYLDPNPLITADKYRVMITDLNGNISYSPVRTLDYGSMSNAQANNAILLYPNPVGSVMNLAVNQNNETSGSGAQLQALNLSSNISNTANSTVYNIKIISLTGSVVKTETSLQPTWQDNVSTLSPGTYVIQVLNNKDKSLVGKTTFIKL